MRRAIYIPAFLFFSVLGPGMVAMGQSTRPMPVDIEAKRQHAEQRRREWEQRGLEQKKLDELDRMSGPDRNPLIAIDDNSIKLFEAGQYRLALQACEEKYHQLVKEFGNGDRDEVASSLNNVAACLDALGCSGEALSKYEASLAMLQRLSKGVDRPLVATGLNNVAICLQSLGRPREALTRYETSLEMNQRLSLETDQPSVARSLNNFAFCLQSLGKYEEALPKYKLALGMFLRLHKDTDNSEVARGFNNIASCLDSLNRPIEALSNAEVALAMFSRLHKESDNADVAESMDTLADCLKSLNRPNEALVRYDAAVGIRRRLGNPDLFRSAHKLGLLQSHLGLLDEAERSLALSIESLEKVRNSLGGDDQDRLTFMSSVRQWGDPFTAMVDLQLRRKRADLAMAYLERGRAGSLMGILERGKRTAGGDVLGPIESAAAARQDKALVTQVRTARSELSSADASVSELSGQINHLRSLNNPSQQKMINYLTQQLGVTQDRYRSARRTVFNLAADNGVSDLKPLGAEALQSLLAPGERMVMYVMLDDRCLALLVPPAGEAIKWEELKGPGGVTVKGKDLTESIGRYMRTMTVRPGTNGNGDRGLTLADESPSTQPAARALPADQQGYMLFQTLIPPAWWSDLKAAPQVYVVPDGAIYRLPLETLVVEKPTEDEKKQSYWLDAGPLLIYGPSGTVLVNRHKARDEQLQRVAQGHGPKETAVLLGDPVFGAGSQSPSALQPSTGVAVLGADAGSPAEQMGLIHGSIITSYGDQPVTSVEQMDKAFDALSAKERRKQLTALPVLRFWRSGVYVEKPISPSQALGVKLADLTTELSKKLQESRGNDEALLAMASVQRSGYVSRFGSLVPLPGTRTEVEAIARSLNMKAGDSSHGVYSLLGVDATRPNLYQKAAGARYVHLATHGLVEGGDRAIYSSLALTQPAIAGAEDNGFLTLIDLFDHWWGRLGDTELVVLSACDSQGIDASGRNVMGSEGVLGLPWGFMYAGSPAVICSLWEVDDKSTAELMAGLYTQMCGSRRPQQQATREKTQTLQEPKPAQPQTKLAAFTEARKKLRQSHPEPYYWAPFIYMGDPR